MGGTSERWEGFQTEARRAREAFGEGRYDVAMDHLERAHVLGQPWAGPHTWSHWMMFRVGLAQRDWTEVCGQVLRLAMGGVLSWLQLLPHGNTGRARVPALKAMAPPQDLRHLVAEP